MTKGGVEPPRKTLPGGRDLRSGPRRIAAATILVLLVAAAYAQVAGHHFIGFDDNEYVTENRAVQAGLGPGGAAWALTTFHAANWHPLTWLSHQVDWTLFGGWAGGHHLTSVLLHAAAALLLMAVVRALTGRFWWGAATAFLWALHPQRVESVAWIAERKDVLSAAFFMLTLLAWTRYVRGDSSNSLGHDPEFHETGNRVMSRNCYPLLPLEGGGRVGVGPEDFGFVIHPPPTPPLKGGEHGRKTVSSVHPRIVTPNRWYFLSLVLFALGLMSKPMLVTLPFVLLLLDWWPLGRLPRVAGSGGIGPLIREKAPFFALSAVSSIMTVVAQSRGGAVVPLEEIAFVERLANAAIAAADYLGKMLWPMNLHLFHAYPGDFPDTWRWLGAALLLAVAVLVAQRARRRQPWLAVGLFWYLGMLVPVSGLVQVGGQAQADRYTYLPVVGLILALVVTLDRAAAARPAARPWLAAAAVAAILGLTAATAVQVSLWKDDRMLFGRVVAVDPGNWLGRMNLGRAMLASGDEEAGLDQYRAIASSHPGSPSLLYSVGVTLLEHGRLDEAAAMLERVLARQPGHVMAAFTLGLLENRRGNAAAAVGRLRQAVSWKPDFAEANFQLGQVLALGGRLEEGREAFAAAVKASPDYGEAHYNLAVVLEELGRSREAEEHYRLAARLMGDTPGAEAGSGR